MHVYARTENTLTKHAGRRYVCTMDLQFASERTHDDDDNRLFGGRGYRRHEIKLVAW